MAIFQAIMPQAIMTIMAILSIMAIMAGHIMAINIVSYGYQAKSTIKTDNLQKKSSEYLYFKKKTMAKANLLLFIALTS